MSKPKKSKTICPYCGKKCAEDYGVHIFVVPNEQVALLLNAASVRTFMCDGCFHTTVKFLKESLWEEDNEK